MNEFLSLCSTVIGNQKKREKIDLNSFFLLRVVGKGSYGKVLMVKKKSSGEVFAMKVLKKANIKHNKQANQIKTEHQILGEVHHPFLVNLKHAFQSDRKIYFVLEYCPGGELFNLLVKQKTLTEEQTKFYAAQVLLAIGYLHSLDIIYRDLKPENILIDKDGYIKITDFGLSKKGIGGRSRAYSVCGTPEYLAPEVLLGKGHGKPVDWWALGALIYELVSGLPPFYNKDHKILFHSIEHETITFPKNISSSLKNLLERLLEKDPSKRLGSGEEDSKEIKDHPWFASVQWEKLCRREIPSPFVPHLDSETDLSYFDKEFTECPVYSFHRPQSESQEYNMSFPDFSFEKSLEKKSNENYIVKVFPERLDSEFLSTSSPEGESGNITDLIRSSCSVNLKSPKSELLPEDLNANIAAEGDIFSGFGSWEAFSGKQIRRTKKY